MAAGSATDGYWIMVGDGRSTEELVEAGNYAYAHSCVTSESFPARHFGERLAREIVLLEFDHDVTAEEAIAEAVQLGLERPMYEDALSFGIEYPDVQRERPVAFLHDPWFGFFGRRDVLCLWSNAGRRGAWSRGVRRSLEPELPFRVRSRWALPLPKGWPLKPLGGCRGR